MRPAVACATLATLALASTAALVGVLVAQPFATAEARPASAQTSATVVQQEFTDQQDVVLTVDAGPAASLLVPVPGRVTALRCTPGGEIVSGSAPLDLDGVPHLALSTSVPWWRDLARGDRGTDVDALHAELTRLGHDVTADGDRVGAATVAAVRALVTAAGGTPGTGSGVALTQMIWLPQASAPVASCALSLGDQVGAGQVLAQVAPTLSGARIAVLPSLLAPGAHVVTVDGQDLAVDDQGVVAPEALAVLARSAAVTAALAGDGTVAASLRLTAPVQVTVVPPQAVTTTDGRTGCVQADGKPVAVSIVGSQLGQTYVVLADGATASEVALAAPEEAACS
jgi:hypothetical protein